MFLDNVGIALGLAVEGLVVLEQREGVLL